MEPREYRLIIEAEDEHDLDYVLAKIRGTLDYWVPGWSLMEVDE